MCKPYVLIALETMRSLQPDSFNSSIDPCSAELSPWFPYYVVYVVPSRPSTLVPPPSRMWGASQGTGDMATGPQGHRATAACNSCLCLTLAPPYGVMRGRTRILAYLPQQVDILDDQ
jgi:hypothetical protein